MANTKVYIKCMLDESYNMHLICEGYKQKIYKIKKESFLLDMEQRFHFRWDNPFIEKPYKVHAEDTFDIPPVHKYSADVYIENNMLRIDFEDDGLAIELAENDIQDLVAFTILDAYKILGRGSICFR